MSIANNIKTLQEILFDSRCKLIAVSKTKPVEDILEATNAGITAFGENKVQELVSKYEALPKNIEWHMIGHLQKNKVKYIAPFIHLIHSVESLKLLQEINKQAAKHNRLISCLLQMYIAKEETKFGLSQQELYDMLSDIGELENVRIRGLMGMATNTDNETVIRKEFQELRTLFEQLRSSHLPANMTMQELSMGMTSDYHIAIEEGSTMIRVGSAIFGSRTTSYKNDGNIAL